MKEKLARIRRDNDDVDDGGVGDGVVSAGAFPRVSAQHTVFDASPAASTIVCTS